MCVTSSSWGTSVEKAIKAPLALLALGVSLR